jgi:anti-anti-sigma factor
MVRTSSSFSRAPDRPLAPGDRHDPDIVVWLRGDQDVSTDGTLCRALARAISLDDAALVVDLSGAELVGLSTLAIIARAREFLGLWSRSLTVRSPSANTRRIIDICGLNDLLGPEEAHGTAGQALGSWVEVPATAPVARRPGSSAPRPAHVGERASQAVDLRAIEPSAEQPA